MMDREKVVKKLEELLEQSRFNDSVGWNPDCDTETLEDAIALLKAQEPITGETSDGYHTFNELYHHRAVLFSVIVANYKDRAWKSVRHHDGTMYDGMFIVGIDTPDGQATYHYDINPYWDMFDCKVREFAPEWDGHTPAQAIERIGKLKAQEPRMPRIMTLEEINAVKQNDVLVYESNAAFKAIFHFIVTEGVVDNELRIKTEFERIDMAAPLETYNRVWRCWTSRPTDEQREAIPWEP